MEERGGGGGGGRVDLYVLIMVYVCHIFILFYVGWGGGGGEVDLYKFLSWFMSVIFLYYFTCMILSRVCVHFHCLLFFVQCTELDGILHYK